MAFVLILMFLALPAIEIYLFITVGDLIGPLPTIGLTVLTAVVGALLVRAQGLTVMRRAQESVDRGEAPVQEALDGLALFVAGVLLVVPGFFTDAIGGLLLIPFVRHAIGIAVMTKLLTMRTRHPTTGGGPGSGNVVDVEFEVVHPDDEQNTDQRPRITKE